MHLLILNCGPMKNIKNIGSNTAHHLLLQTLYKEFDNIRHEEIGITGLRFDCIDFADMKRILENYGYKHNPEF